MIDPSSRCERDAAPPGRGGRRFFRKCCLPTWLALCAALLLPAGAARALDYLVTVGTDDGPYGTGVGTDRQGDFRYCWIEAQKYNPGGRPLVNILIQTSQVTLTKSLPPWVPAVPQDVNIQGPFPRQINSNLSGRIFFFDAPGSVITLRDLALINGRAKGGNGNNRGGGGAGLGGALFVASGSVTLRRVTFNGNQAIGGSSFSANYLGGGGGLGGDGGPSMDQGPTGGGGGGGGGYYGSGGSAWNGSAGSGGGGGGLWSNGANASDGLGGGGGGTSDPAGQNGPRTAAAGGGTGGDDAQLGGSHASFVNGDNAVALGGGGGGGGRGASGVPGGHGGQGQKFGGGGGSGVWSVSAGSRGGQGGDYAGGGGGNNLGALQGGNGGFGGGGGSGPSAGGTGGFGAGNGGHSSQQGGGGSGYGGAIFLRENVQLNYVAGALAGGSVTAGSPGGSAAGDGAYLMSGSVLAFTLEESALIFSGGLAGSGAVQMVGPANTVLELGGANTYTGPTTIETGTLRLGPAGTVPPGLINIYDFATLDLAGKNLGVTPDRLNGSTGTITNSAAGTTSTATVTASGARTDLTVELRDGAGAMALRREGANLLRLTRNNVTSAGVYVTGGTLELAGGDAAGLGAVSGDLTVDNGTVTLTKANALGYLAGRKVNTIALTGSSLLNAVDSDQGWGIAYTLANATLSSNGGQPSQIAASKFAFGGESTPTSVRVTANSEIRGRVDLRPDFNRTLVDFTVEAGATLDLPAAVTSAAGPVGLRKKGAGALTLRAFNGYTGDTIVEAGTLNLSAPGSDAVGTIKGRLEIGPAATVVATVGNAFGYENQTRVTQVSIDSGALLFPINSDLGWGVAYTLSGTAAMSSNNGVPTTTGGRFALGGPSGTPSTITVSDGANATIAGRVHLRTDNGNANTPVTTNGNSVLTVSAAVTGPGGLIKDGPGTLILAAGNNFSGGTRVQAGRLGVTSAAALGSASVTLAGGILQWVNYDGDLSSAIQVSGAVPFAFDTNAQNVQLNGPFTGAADLTKYGAGNLRLGGSNGFTGLVRLQEGTLQPVTPAALGSARLVFNGGFLRYGGYDTDLSGRFEFNGSGPVAIDTDGRNPTFGTPIQGSLGLSKTGEGVLRLPLASTYGGLTRLFGGTLAIGSAQALGSSRLVFAGGTLRYEGFTTDLSDRIDPAPVGPVSIDTNGLDITFAHPLQMSSLRKRGLGRLILTGNSQSTANVVHSLEAGTLQLGDGGSTGSLHPFGVPIQNDARLVVRRSGEVTLAGMGGSGELVLDGPGTLLFGGNGFYAGPTTINGGTFAFQGNGLYANGTLPGSVLVNAGGTLRFDFSDAFGPIDSNPQPTVSVAAGGLVRSGANVTTFRPLQLTGGELRAEQGDAVIGRAFVLSSGATVAGSAPSRIATAVGTPGSNAIGLGSNAVFQVGDVTNSAEIDLFVAAFLVDRSANPFGPLGRGSLVKSGPGTLELRGLQTYTGDTKVQQGTLLLATPGTLGAAPGGIQVSAGAVLDVSANGLTVEAGRTLANAGTIRGPVQLAGVYSGTGLIDGSLTIATNNFLDLTGPTVLHVRGTLTNFGYLRLLQGAVLDPSELTGLTNLGILDLMTAGAGTALPANFTNNGIVLLPSLVKVRSASRTLNPDGQSAAVTVVIDGYAGRTYQLQRSTDLAGGVFTPLGAPQGGSGFVPPTPLTFLDPAAPLQGAFYRVSVMP